MTDMPEHIYAWQQMERGQTTSAGGWISSKTSSRTEYTRADLIPAMLEAARQEALEEAVAILDHEYDACRKLRKEYRQSDVALDTVGDWIKGYAAAIRALAASPPTPTPVDGENSGETVGKGGA
jgi:hypothetical protein